MDKEQLIYLKRSYEKIISDYNKIFLNLELLFDKLSNTKLKLKDALMVDEEIYKTEEYDDIMRNVINLDKYIRNSLLPLYQGKYNEVVYKLNNL